MLTHDIIYLAHKLRESRLLSPTVADNLVILVELRDTAVHFFHQTGAVSGVVQELGTACLMNFAAVLKDWFQRDLADYNFYLMPLTFFPATAAKGIALTASEDKFLNYVRAFDRDSSPDDGYALLVEIGMSFTRQRGREGATLVAEKSKDPQAIQVVLSDNQLKERYPWDYAELTNKLKQRFVDFKQDREYHALRREFESDESLAYTRRLDPSNPKSNRKIFYSPNIVSRFDRHYNRSQQ
jgi:hypothetical protein